MPCTCSCSLGGSLVTCSCPVLLLPHHLVPSWPCCPPSLISLASCSAFRAAPPPRCTLALSPAAHQAAPQGGPCLEALPAASACAWALAQTWLSPPPAGAFFSPTLSSRDILALCLNCHAADPAPHLGAPPAPHTAAGSALAGCLRVAPSQGSDWNQRGQHRKITH